MNCLPVPNLLLTGFPGVGKTTLIRKLCAEVAHLNPVGFYTEEIREGGTRRGFALVSLDKQESILSHVDIKSQHRVGKYGIDIPGFERFLESVEFNRSDCGLIVIDEIGKMECFSPVFEQLLLRLLDSERILVATIAQKGGGLIAKVKQRPDVGLITVDRSNRDDLPSHLASLISEPQS